MRTGFLVSELRTMTYHWIMKECNQCLACTARGKSRYYCHSVGALCQYVDPSACEVFQRKLKSSFRVIQS